MYILNSIPLNISITLSVMRYPQTRWTETSWRDSKLHICVSLLSGSHAHWIKWQEEKDAYYLSNFSHFFLAGVVEFIYIKSLIMMWLHYTIFLGSSWLYYQVESLNYFQQRKKVKHSSVSLRAALLVWGNQHRWLMLLLWSYLKLFRAHYLIHSTDMTRFLILPNLPVNCFHYS